MQASKRNFSNFRIISVQQYFLYIYVWEGLIIEEAKLYNLSVNEKSNRDENVYLFNRVVSERAEKQIQLNSRWH